MDAFTISSNNGIADIHSQSLESQCTVADARTPSSGPRRGIPKSAKSERKTTATASLLAKEGEAEQGGSSEPGWPAESDALHSVRPYRSRKNRPCDRCRTRKTRCHILADADQCLHCNLGHAECRIDGKPYQKSAVVLRDGQEPPSTSLIREGSRGLAFAKPPQVLNDSLINTADTQYLPSALTSLPLASLNAHFGGADQQHLQHAHASVPTNALEDLAQTAHNLSEASYTALDAQADDDTELLFVGTASERDALSLARLAYSSASPEVQSNGGFSGPSGTNGPLADASLGVPGLRIREVSRAPSSSPATFVYYKARPYPDSVPSPRGSLQELTALLGTDTVQASLTAFFENDGQALPIWAPEHSATTASLHAGVQSSCITSGLIYLSPAARRHIHRAWSSNLAAYYSFSPRARLATIQAVLLNLNGRTAIDPAGNFVRFASVIAVAQLLGLHRDCSDWTIPDWEKQLRIRLWWALLQHDRITGLLFGRQPLILANNHDIPLPSAEYDSSPSYSAFIGLCELAQIADDINRRTILPFQSELGNLAAAQMQAREKMNTIKSAKGTLMTWRSQYASLYTQGLALLAPGVSCLQLVDLYCGLVLARERWEADTASQTLPDAALSECLTCSQSIVEFLEGLTSAHLNGYWSSHCPFILSSCLTMLVRLALHFLRTSVSPTPPQQDQNNAHAIQLLRRPRAHKARAQDWGTASELSVALEPLQEVLPMPPSNDELAAFFESILTDKAFESLFTETESDDTTRFF